MRLLSMKRIAVAIMISLLAVSFMTGCKKKISPDLPTCEISAPVDGAVHNLFEDLTLIGDGADSDGEIVEVILSVNGEEIPEVGSVPFEYKILKEDLEQGVLKIALKVVDDGGNIAEDEVSVSVQDLSDAPTCKIISPAHGSELNVFSDFVIEGEGSAVSGEMKSVVLKINEEVLSEVTSLPFEVTVDAESYSIGTYILTLEVENTCGKSAKDMVTFTLADLNIEPVCEISAPAEGTEFEAEDAIVIKGDASDEDGSIKSVSLKINDAEIPTVTAVPFEYAVPAEYKVPGNMNISLTVTDNNGKSSTDVITVIVLGQFREFTDPRDNKTYKTVKIGDQLWFGENLAYLPQVAGPKEGSKETPCYYVYGYDGTDVSAAKETESYKTRGVLYNWAAAGGSKESKPADMPSGIQGPCPDGWHVPSEAEWNVLYDYVRDRIPDEEAAKYWDGSFVKNVSGHLRSKGDWPIADDADFPQLTKGGMDTYGFCVRVTGQRLSGMFYKGPDDGGNSCVFWTPHYDDVTYPSNPGGVSTSISNYKYEIDYSRGSATDRAYPVRCLKD